MKNKFIIIGLIFIAFTSKVNADLLTSNSLNLYNSIDNGIEKLKEEQLNYEMKGGNKIGDISKNINDKLKADGLKPCLLPGLTYSDLNGIVSNNWNKNKFNTNTQISGNVNKLAQDFKPECIKNFFTISNVNDYIISIRKYINNAKIRANEKTKQIYSTSKIGIYTDGNINNSPFDLIQDLQDINTIIFGKKLEYNGIEDSDNNFLKEFEKDPFKDKLINNNGKKSGSSNNNNNNNNNGKNNGSPNNNKGKNNIENNDNNLNISQIPDGNNYICPQYNDQSGLDPNNLQDIENDISSNKLTSKKYIFKLTKSGHLKLPDTNKIDFNYPKNNIINNSNSIINPLLHGNYNSINDNAEWKCSPDSFFCITIDFITHKHNLLGYGKTKSIQNIIEVSNGHLKKGANTSLLQAKMGTNNFENILRDLDFSKMFHMGIIITKKSPPILNIENIKKKKENESYTKKKLIKLYKNQGLDYNKKNDLNNLKFIQAKQREIINSAGLSNTSSSEKEKTRMKFLNQLKIQNNFINNNQIQIINNDGLKDFYNQFVEYEKYISGLDNYANALAGYIKKMYKIPRGD